MVGGKRYYELEYGYIVIVSNDNDNYIWLRNSNKKDLQKEKQEYK